MFIVIKYYPGIRGLKSYLTESNTWSEYRKDAFRYDSEKQACFAAEESKRFFTDNADSAVETL